MRFGGKILALGLAGLFVVGGLVFFWSDLMSLVPGSGTNALQQPGYDKRRYAPYVVLVPSNPLPEQMSEQDKAPEPAKQSQASAPALVPAKVEERPAEPVPPTPKVAEAMPDEPKTVTSDFARQVLQAVQTEQRDTPAPEAEAPKAPPVEPEPKVVASTPKTEAKAPPAPSVPVVPEPPTRAAPELPARVPQAAAVPAPAAEQATAPQQPTVEQPETRAPQRGETKLKYEREVARLPDDAKEKLVAKENVRYRKVVPLAPGQLKSGDTVVSLAGVDALSADATCLYDTGKTWDCGRWGTLALRRLIRARSVVCDLTEVVSDVEAVGECSVGSTEINRWIVRSGWGRPTSSTLEMYAEDFKKAKTERRGQWSKDPDSAN